MGPSSRLVPMIYFPLFCREEREGVKGTSKPSSSYRGAFVRGSPHLPTLELSAALALGSKDENSISCPSSHPRSLNSASSHTEEAPHCVL